MIFRIEEGAFERIKGEAGVISLRCARSGRMLFLPESARGILETRGEWADSRDFANEANSSEIDGALNALSAFGLCEIKKVPQDDGEGCRVAGERDYSAISEFMLKNAASPLGFAPVADEEYYQDVNIRSRQFNNIEYNFLKKRSGAIIADLVMAVPSDEEVISVAEVRSAVFDEALEDGERRECLQQLVSYARAAFKGEFEKFRLAYADARQNWLRDALLDMGFVKICTLEREIMNSVDLTIYDRFVK